MRSPFRSATAVLAGILATAPAAAHVRLIHPGNGAPLHWADPASVSIVIASAGSDDLPGRFHLPALRGAIAAWNAVSGSRLRLVEDTDPAQQARSDWEADDLHQIRFDEENASGYFPDGSGLVAITPVWFRSDGRITDADVLLNGAGFRFATDGAIGRFDVQDVATHELGHLAGLDHSGWAGATMYPYVWAGGLLQRSLSEDERGGMRDAYPDAAFASIAGTVRRASNGAAVPGAHVVARDADGRTSRGALSDAAGRFRLAGLEPGTYELLATPLDSPVSAGNLGGSRPVAVDFESTPLGTLMVAAGQALEAGDLEVERDVAIGLGRTADHLPLRAIAGETRLLQLRGSGLVPGSTLAASDPRVAIAPLAWFGTAVTFEATVPGGALPGHVDLLATDALGERSLLPAALEVTPPDPEVTRVSPAAGDPLGGTAVTITGSGFSAGSRVVIGDVAYADGEPGGCTVLPPGSIQLVTAPTVGGLHDVAVLDPSGVEGRAAGAFLVATTPRIDTVFPGAGSALGGTRVVLRGEQFAVGCVVRIAGVPQGPVTSIAPTRLEFVTVPGTAGGPLALEVENPGGQTTAASFSFVASADPAIASVEPPRGSAGGGDTVLIRGSGFAAGAEVVFGADADTGTGGVAAQSTIRIDASTLEVVTPAHASGTASVLVRVPATGQATIAEEAFEFRSRGGGGGCSAATLPGPRGPLEPLAGAAWLLLLAAILGWRARRARIRLRLG